MKTARSQTDKRTFVCEFFAKVIGSLRKGQHTLRMLCSKHHRVTRAQSKLKVIESPLLQETESQLVLFDHVCTCAHQIREFIGSCQRQVQEGLVELMMLKDLMRTELYLTSQLCSPSPHIITLVVVLVRTFKF